MNWKNPKIILIPSISDFKVFGSKTNLAQNIKDSIIDSNNRTCMLCGGIYKKGLICYNENDLDTINTIVACRLCYIIQHLNYDQSCEFDLFVSNINQRDIVRLTIDFIIKNNKIPEPKIIDPNLQPSKLSLIEYINLINNNDYNDLTKNIRLFVNKTFDHGYLFNRSLYTFINDD